MRSGSLERSPGALWPPCELALVFFLGSRGDRVGSPRRSGQAPRPRAPVGVSRSEAAIRDGLGALPSRLSGQRPCGPDLRAPGAPAPRPFGGSLRSLDGGSRLLFRVGSPVLGSGARTGSCDPGMQFVYRPQRSLWGTERVGVIGAPRPLSLGGSDAGQDPPKERQFGGYKALASVLFVFFETFYGGGGGVRAVNP